MRWLGRHGSGSPGLGDHGGVDGSVWFVLDDGEGVSVDGESERVGVWLGGGVEENFLGRRGSSWDGGSGGSGGVSALVIALDEISQVGDVVDGETERVHLGELLFVGQRGDAVSQAVESLVDGGHAPALSLVGRDSLPLRDLGTASLSSAAAASVAGGGVGSGSHGSRPGVAVLRVRVGAGLGGVVVHLVGGYPALKDDLGGIAGVARVVGVGVGVEVLGGDEVGWWWWWLVLLRTEVDVEGAGRVHGPVQRVWLV